MNLPPRLLRNPFLRIRHISGQAITYLENPKVACSSIQLTMWRAHEPSNVPRVPHQQENRPFIRNVRRLSEADKAELLSSVFFSVVRNPFSRTLSTYLNKVGPRRKPWARISARLGLSADQHPSLEDLLRALLDNDPLEADKHLQPQWINVLHDFAPLDYIGHLERIEAVAAYMNGFGFTLERSHVNTTNANDKVRKLVSDKAAEFILRYYARDFDLYGYGEDLSVLEPVREADVLNPSRQKLREAIEAADQVLGPG